MLETSSERSFLNRFSADSYRQISPREPVTLSVILVGGLVFVAPVLGLSLRQMGISRPLPMLGATAAVGGVYALYVLHSQRLYLGFGVAVLVTSTFSANFPLIPDAISAHPGNLGPHVWLFQLPLVALVAAQALRGEFHWKSVTRLEFVFGAFVLWTVAAAVFGNPSRQNTALYFSLYMAFIWLGIATVTRLVRSRTMSLRQAVGVFLATTTGHTVFAVAQYLNRRPFGLTFLGESGRLPANTVLEFAPLGRYLIGVHISGFTGGNGPLSVLLVFAIPLLVVFGYEHEGWVRWPAFLGAITMAFVLRTTGKDGARGALLTSFLVLGGLATLSWWAATDRNWRGSLVSAATRLQVVGVAAVFSVVAVLLPSTKSGMTSAMGIDGSGGSGSTASGSSQSSSGLPSETGGSGGHAGTTNVTDISIPYFDLQTLGIRLQQYLGGLYIAADHPLFGVGGGNYPFVAGRYGLPEKLGGGWFPLHNVYIAALAETGIPGFLLYATASVMVVWAGWCLYRSGGADRAFHAGLLAAVIGYLAVAFWVVNVRFTMVLPFWLVAAALYAEYAGDLFGTETIA